MNDNELYFGIIEEPKNNLLFESAKTLVEEVSTFGITCDTVASERLHKFAQALIESRRLQYADAGKKIKKLDENGVCRIKAIIYAMMTIGTIFSKDAFDLELKYEPR